MSNVLDLARAHYGRLRNQKIAVPEWSAPGGPDFEVCYSPLTLRQRQKLNERAGEKNPARLMALAVILFSRDATGEPIFEDNAATLKAFENELDPAVVARVAGAMLGTSEADDLGN